MKKKRNLLKKETAYSDLFMYMSIVFVVCLLVSNILAAKLLKIGNYSVTAGVLVFPISYIINDIFSEVYGYEKTKKVIIFGLIMNVFMVLVLSLAIILPAPVWFENNEAFKTILGSTPRTCLASLMAYLFGSLVNAKVLVKMKKNTKGKFGIRAIVSTIFGEFTDSLIFVFIAFIGKIPFIQIISMILIQVIFKTLYEVICLPVTTVCVKKVRNYEEKFGD